MNNQTENMQAMQPDEYVYASPAADVDQDDTLWLVSYTYKTYESDMIQSSYMFDKFIIKAKSTDSALSKIEFFFEIHPGVTEDCVHLILTKQDEFDIVKNYKWTRDNGIDNFYKN